MENPTDKGGLLLKNQMSLTFLVCVDNVSFMHVQPRHYHYCKTVENVGKIFTLDYRHDWCYVGWNVISSIGIIRNAIYSIEPLPSFKEKSTTRYQSIFTLNLHK